MISPLGRGHRGGALSISSDNALDSSWAGEATAAAEGSATGVLGPATVAAPGVEVPVGGVELRRTHGR